MQNTTKTVTTVLAKDSEVTAVRQIFQGMPMADRLTAFMLIKGSDFHSLLETDSGFADLLATALYEMAGRIIEREIKSRRWWFPSADREDLVHELLVHLLKVVSRFDPSYGIPLAKYADNYLRRSRDLIGKWLRRKYCETFESVETNQLEDETEDSPFEIPDDRHNPEKVVVAEDLKQKLLSRFPARSRKSRETAQRILEDPFDTSDGKVQRCRVRRRLREILSELESGSIVNQRTSSLEKDNWRCEKQ